MKPDRRALAAPRRLPSARLSVAVCLLVWGVAASAAAQPAAPVPSDPLGSAVRPRIQSAAETDYPPFCFADANGEATGFSVELLRAALAAMGRDVSFRTGIWADVRGWLERGEIEALPLVGRTPEREELFDFTVPYMSLHGAIVVRNETEGVAALEDLRGRTVAVLQGDNAEEFLRREDRGVHIVAMATLEEAFQDLSDGRCDAVVVQRLVALRLINEMGLTNLRVIDRPIEGFRQDFCFAVTEGDRDTLALLNEGLALVIADGTYRELHSKWFAALELPTHRKIVIGGHANLPPYEYLDDRGRPAGFAVELTEAIAEAMGLDIEIRLGAWSEIRAGFETGEIDAVQSMHYSPERDRRYDFTPAYAVADHVGVVRPGGKPPSAIGDLVGRRLVAERDSLMHAFVVELGLEGQLTLVDDQEQALREVVEGRQDCALVGRLPATHWMKEHGWTHLEMGRSLLTRDYCYAVSPGERALLAQLSEGLRALDESGAYRRIHEKWLGVYDRGPGLLLVLRYVAAALVPLLAILLGAAVWTWTLRRQVAQRTADLQRSETQFRSLVEGVPDAIFVQTDGDFAYLNASACALFGAASPEDLLGASVPDRVHPRFREQVAERIRRLRDERKPVPATEEIFLRIDGTEVPVEVSAVPVHFEGRDGAVVFVRDVTQQKRTERVNEVRFSLVRWSADHSLSEVMRKALDEISALVQSPLAFLHFIEADQQTVSLQQWSTETAEAWCGVRDLELHYSLDKAGVWTDCVAARGPVIHEDYASLSHRKGMPEGHPQITRELLAPVLREDRVVAVLGVGNKPTAYTEDDVETVSFLADVAWEILLRKRAEESLRHRQEMLARTEAIAHVGSWEWDPETDSLWASEELLRIAGLNPNPEGVAIASDEFLSRVERDDAKALQRTVKDVAADGAPREALVRIVRPDGAIRRCLVRGHADKDADGRIVRIYGSAMDVTEYRKATERIEHLNRVLRTIRDINQLIARERDRNALIQQTCELLVANRGYASALLVLTNDDERPTAWAQEGMEAEFPAVSEQLERGDLPACCAFARVKGETTLLSDRAVACPGCPLMMQRADADVLVVRLLHDSVSYGYLTVAVEHSLGVIEEEQELFAELAADIAYGLYVLRVDEARAASEERSAVLEDQLIQAQRLESVGRLAGGVAHDYNNMLSVIIGYTELALDRIDEDDPLHEDLGEVLRAAQRSADITRQLLAFARKQTIAPRVIDLNATVEGMLKMLQRLIGENIDLAWAPAPRLGPVRMDPAQIDQMLANLCVNARDAIDGVGRITIETENAAFDEAYCAAHPGFESGEYVRLAVSDDGCGMDRETLEHAFDPFFTTKGVGEGTGLGLATVYGIVRQNDGFINVYSEPGKGTTFRIYLPRYDAEWAELVAERAAEIPLGHAETVMVVEDDPAIMRMANVMLNRLGYTVLAAASPTLALDVAKAHAGEIQLLVTDVVMPEMNGRDLAEQIHQLYPDVRILFMSGYTANVIAHHGVLDEGVHFIQKPFSVEDLASAVKKALA